MDQFLIPFQGKACKFHRQFGFINEKTITTAIGRYIRKSKGALEYISILPLMIPEIILGMVLMAFFYMLNLPFGMLTLLIGHTVFCVPLLTSSES